MHELPKNLNLSGCSYKRILFGNDIDKFLKVIEYDAANKKVFDLRSFMQLESFLRTEDRIVEADKVYIKRRTRQHEQLKGLPKFIDNVFAGLTNYGTDNSIMITWSVMILWCSMLFFISPLASVVTETEKGMEKTCYEFLSTKAIHFKETKFIDKAPVVNDIQYRPIIDLPRPLAQAFLISLEQFLPFNLPFFEEYKPNNDWTRAVSIIEKITGWIFIPLLVANLSGFFNNKAKPQG